MTDADNVGWLFIHQYYSQLNIDPSQQHRFYTSESRLVHSEGASQGSPAVGQREIKAKFAELSLKNCQVMIDTVDCLPSVNHGILVQAMGQMSNNGNASKRFVQTFLLTPNERGFFIQNDLLRFYTEAKVEPQAASEVQAVTEAEAEPEAQPAEQLESIQAVPEAEQFAEPEAEFTAEPEPSLAAPAAAPVASAAPTTAVPAPKSAAPASGALCNDVKEESPQTNGKTEAEAEKPDSKKPFKPKRTPKQTHSAYVRNVPKDVDEKALYNALSWFGRLSHFQCEPSRSRAFVDFADAQALERALIRGKVTVNDVVIPVERRKRKTD